MSMQSTLPVSAMMERFGLPAPWVPEEWTQRVHAVGVGHFGTRDELPGFFNPGALAQEAACGAAGDYVLYGSGGRGMQSNTVNYALVLGPLALFLEQSIGSVYGDNALDVQSIRREWALTDELCAEVARHSWAPGERLVVIASDLAGTLWARLPAPLSADEWRTFTGWQSVDNPIADLRPVIHWLEASPDEPDLSPLS